MTKVDGGRERDRVGDGGILLMQQSFYLFGEQFFWWSTDIDMSPISLVSFRTGEQY